MVHSHTANSSIFLFSRIIVLQQNHENDVLRVAPYEMGVASSPGFKPFPKMSGFHALSTPGAGHEAQAARFSTIFSLDDDALRFLRTYGRNPFGDNPLDF